MPSFSVLLTHISFLPGCVCLVITMADIKTIWETPEPLQVSGVCQCVPLCTVRVDRALHVFCFSHDQSRCLFRSLICILSARHVCEHVTVSYVFEHVTVQGGRARGLGGFLAEAGRCLCMHPSIHPYSTTTIHAYDRYL